MNTTPGAKIQPCRNCKREAPVCIERNEYGGLCFACCKALELSKLPKAKP